MRDMSVSEMCACETLQNRLRIAADRTLMFGTLSGVWLGFNLRLPTTVTATHLLAALLMACQTLPTAGIIPRNWLSHRQT